MAAKKLEQFALPISTDAAQARLRELSCAILEARPLVEQLTRLMAAKDVLRAAEAEAAFLNDNLEGIRRADFERQVDEYEITAIENTVSGDATHNRAGFPTYNVHGLYKGAPFTAPLANQSRVLLAAVARRPELIPFDVLRRADTPLDALLRNVRDVNRGYRD
ncbi:hypothetical protein CI15_18990 [Paraburkholderia monticola]|uniref:Uncharacterized protein n=1 Tax=Paraburkholderia monticola TaxID=1399968 RepID=A0A149PNF2_9BURK|nr:hypothetical protein [Paraburkholderia monticola]KXU86524.1 hypothetical protein CI15_18990 [Paraburkholderia monticola]